MTKEICYCDACVRNGKPRIMTSPILLTERERQILLVALTQGQAAWTARVTFEEISALRKKLGD